MAESSISICEWIFGRLGLAKALAAADHAGYDGIELAGEPDRPDRERLPEMLAGTHVTGTSSMAKWPTDERDLSHPDRQARRHAVDYYMGCVHLAVEVGAPVVGVVPTSTGRIKPLSSYREEWQYAVEGVREIALYAGEHGVRIAIEPLNRYETFLVNRVEQALDLANETGVPSIGVTADAFHMRMEESDPAEAVRFASTKLVAIQVADSNRLGLGHGSSDIASLLTAAFDSGFDGPVVLECMAPGIDPFEPNKEPDAMAMLDTYANETAEAVRTVLRRMRLANTAPPG